MNHTESSITMPAVIGLVLTGGKNTRMNGQIKLFLPCVAEPSEGSADVRTAATFGDRIFLALSSLDEICLSADRSEPYAHLPYSVITDEIPGQGPMGGIVSAFHARPGHALFVTASDCPFLTGEIVQTLLLSYQSNPVLTLARINGRIQPLLGIYPPSTQEALESLLACGDRKMMHLTARVNYQTVDFSVPEEAANINSPVDYRNFRVNIRRKGITLEEAQAILLQEIESISRKTPVGSEELPLLDSLGRILAEDVTADHDQPPFPRSPLDGFAFRGADSAGASPDNPIQLRLKGIVYAGGFCHETIGPGEAIRIMTGAPIPSGADCVIRQEDTIFRPDRGIVSLLAEVRPYENYCPQGEDYQAGDLLLSKGSRIQAGSLAVLGSLGRERVLVKKQPSVSVFSTGDELVSPEQPLAEGKIYDSNLPYVLARCRELGVPVAESGHVPDDPQVMASLIRKASVRCPLIITTGGVSVGDKDILHDTARLLGVDLLFWRVKVKPGSPTLAFRYRDTLVICLSGNPFGVVANLELLVRPVFAALYEDPSIMEDPYMRIIKADADSGTVRREMAETSVKDPALSPPRRFLRARCENGVLTILEKRKGAGSVSSLARCNCLVEADRRSPVDPPVPSPAPSSAPSRNSGSMKKPLIFAISGYKNSGKTTLITELIPILQSKGLRVAVIKHDGHDFEGDVPGTDSWRFHQAGAYGTAVFSANRFLIQKEDSTVDEQALIKAFPEADLILLEGFKHSPYPKYLCRYPEEPVMDARELADALTRMLSDPDTF